MALSLVALAGKLVDAVADVAPSAPSRRELDRIGGPDRLVSEAVQKGLDAVGWIYDERGLGGGREQDGLSWQLPLDRLWENYVEAVIRRDVAKTGSKISVTPPATASRRARAAVAVVRHGEARKARVVAEVASVDGARGSGGAQRVGAVGREPGGFREA